MVRFHLLGSAQVSMGEQQILLPPTKPSIVLAMLLLRANSPVAVDRLFDVVWDYAPPASARTTLQTYVLRLRRTFQKFGVAECPVRTVPGGYLMEATPESLDLMSFRSHSERAHECAEADNPDAELAHLSAALQLWLGPPLGNIPSEALHREEVPRLTEELLEATERRFDLELGLGRHRGALPELRSIVAAYPHRERFWEQLVEALYHAGRQSEALAEHRKVKQLLLDELGVDPGPGLQRLELEILRGRPAPEPDAVPSQPVRITAAPGAADNPGNCQLPLDIPDFVGRPSIAATLADKMTARNDRIFPAIAVIRGAPGVGKTALALHVAHHIRKQFPDGQWYLSLSNCHGLARAPEDVLQELFAAAGIERSRIPADMAASASLFRSVMTDRRVLLVLDDAVSVAQVAPLLPGAGGSGALVTSRMTLLGLTALWGIKSYLVEPLTQDDSIELLARMIGADLVAADPDAAADIVEFCAGLPLALRIAAVRFVERSDANFSDYSRLLRAGGPSKLFVGSDPSLSIQHVLDLSYRRLSEPGRAMFRLIGHQLNAQFTLAQLFGVTDTPPGPIEDTVEELVDASLLRRRGSAFTMVTLIHRFAAELTDTTTGIADEVSIA